MRLSFKTSMLVALVATTIGLSIAMFGMRRVEAQATEPDAWFAEDPARAVETLLGAHGITYLDQARVPGHYHTNSVRSFAHMNTKGLKSRAGGVKIAARDGSMAHRAFRPEPGAYAYQNAYASFKKTPSKTGTSRIGEVTPRIELEGRKNTRFEALPGGETSRRKTTTDPVIKDRGTKNADKVGISLKSDQKTATIPVTTVQLRQFKQNVKQVLNKGEGKATAQFAGSLDKDVALFVPIIQVSGGVVTQFKIEALPDAPR
jgi:hypothetical protein